MLLAAVRAVPFFRHLPDDTLSALAERLRPAQHPAGTLLFRAGDLADRMFFVETGQLEAFSDPDREPLASLGPGSFVGEIALLLDQPRSATVRVVADAQLLELGRGDLESLLDEHPLIGVELSRELSRRLVATSRRLTPQALTQCVAVHGDVSPLARALDAAEPGRIAVAVLPGAAPAGGLPETVGVLPADDLDEPRLASWALEGVPGRGRLLLALPPRPTALAQVALGVSEYAVALGTAPDWVRQGRLRHRVLRSDGTPPSLRRVCRWIRGRATGLALSSGGSKSVAHFGVVRVLREMGVAIDAVAGTSGGAAVAAGVACGLSEADMLAGTRALARRFQLRRFDFNLIPRTALSKGLRVRQIFDEYVGGRTFADTEIPLWLIATDLASGQEVVLDRGPLADAMRASMSMPVFFNPWRHNGRLLIDGAVCNPLPASVLREAGVRRVIGSNVAGQEIVIETTEPGRVPNALQIVVRMMNSMEREMLKAQIPLVDVMIRPRVNTGYSFDFSRMDEFVREGERAAREDAGDALAALVRSDEPPH
jgi:NTE family protein